MTGVGTGTKRFKTLASRNTRTIFGLILLLVGAVTSQGKAWRGIVPLHSTRADVERLLGPPSMNRGDTVVYEYERERASIEYSKGPCNVNTWNVAANTVINIWVSPRYLYLSDLKLNLTQYAKKQDQELPYIYNYVDEKNGLRYQVDENRSQIVTLIEYFSAQTDAKLRCPCAPPRRSNQPPVRKPRKNRRSRVS